MKLFWEEQQKYLSSSSSSSIRYHPMIIKYQARIQRGDLGIYPPSIFWKWKLFKMFKLMETKD